MQVNFTVDVLFAVEISFLCHLICSTVSFIKNSVGFATIDKAEGRRESDQYNDETHFKCKASTRFLKERNFHKFDSRDLL